MRPNRLPLCLLLLAAGACASEQALTDPSIDPDDARAGLPHGIVENVEAPGPWGVAVRDDGLAFFTEVFSGGVGVISTKSRTVDGFTETGPIPTGIVFSPDGRTIYVANQFGDVSVIDVASRQVVGSIAVANPLAVRVSPDGNRLFVATGRTSVVIVDVPTLTVIKDVEVGFAPNGFAVHPRGRLLYVSSFLGGTVSEIDMITENVVRTFTLGGTPQEMALNRKGTRLYVANEAGFLDEIDLTTGQLASQIPLQGGAFGIGITPDDGKAYISIPFSGVVQVFMLQNRKFAKTLQVGGEPRRIGFSQRGHIAAVTNQAGYISFVR